MKKSQEKSQETPHSNPIYAGMIKIVFEVVKHFLTDMETTRSSKKNEEFHEQFEDLRHTFIKMEKKIDDCRQEIERLKDRLLWSNIFFLILIGVLIAQMLIR